MSAVFPRWTNTFARATLLALLLLMVAVPAALMGWVRTSSVTGKGNRVDQPMAFDHRIHVSGLQLNCQYCHAGVERSANAGLPPTRACVGCHSSTMLSSAPFSPVRHSIASGQAIRWNRVNAVPDFVFFNHAVHTHRGIGCVSCHGHVETMGQVRQVAPLTMNWCVSCHRESGASTTCTACHR